MPDAATYRPEELRPGLTAEFEHPITEDVVLAFARNTGDWNPLHVDEDYAGTTAFGHRLVHGAYQVGLASAMIGMHLPGRNVLLVSVQAQFPSPLHFPCRVRVRGEIVSWDLASLRGNLRVTVTEIETGTPVGDIHLGFTYHHAAAPREDTARQPATSVAAGAPVVLVTGGSGGIGTVLVRDLARDHTVLAMVHRQGLREDSSAPANLRVVHADLAHPDWAGRVHDALGGAALYGIVHAAWPGLPRGGLLSVGPEVVERQVAFGSTYTIALAHFLAAHAGKEGGRLVVLGSTAGSRTPVLGLAAYSLGKGLLEQTIRLLAPELAAHRITANVVCPSFVPVGMNRAANERQQMLEAARVPMGRLCEPADIVAAVRYLFSPAAAFVSGQVLGLTGAQI